MPPDDQDRTDAPPAFGAWDEPDPRAEAIPVVYPEPDPEPVFCRRCGETSPPEGNCCPWCGAWIVGERPRAKPVYSIDDDEPEDDWDSHAARAAYVVPVAAPPLLPPLLVVFGSYGLLIFTLIAFVVFAVVAQLSTEEDMLAGQVLIEVVDAFLIVGALALVWRQAKQRVPAGAMALTWVVAIPVLCLLLCVNYVYITSLRELLKPIVNTQPAGIQVTFATVMLICVWPAIFEELFFRQMTLGVFRKSMNLHLAVWVTAAMFAIAHLGNPLGMPYLFIAGGVFGYARVYGGLGLPMVMHFIHNFAVIAYEAWK